MHLDSDAVSAACSGLYCAAEEDLSCVELLMLLEAASVQTIMLMA